jgi:uridylate kinase
VPFDPVAAKTAEKLRLTVKFVKGTDLTAVEAALNGGSFGGTIVR